MWAQSLQTPKHMLHLRHEVGLLTHTPLVQVEVKPMLNYL